MKRFFQIICVVLSFVMVSSCSTKIEEDSYDIIGYWKFTGFNGKEYPDDYRYIQVTGEMIAVYDRQETLVNTFGYKRKNNTLTLSAPFAGEFKTILIDSASYNETAKLGQMSWDCGNGQRYYFGIWDR